MCIYIYIYMCVCVYIYIYIFIYMCVCVCVCVSIYKCTYIYYHHHQVVQLAWISLTLSCQSSLLSITTGRSSSLYPVFIQSCCRYVFLDHPTLTQLCEVVHKRISLVISFLLLQQCPTCLVCLTWMVLEIGGRWLYNCFMWCCFQDLFNTAHNILVQLSSSFFFICFVSIHTVQLIQPWLGKKSRFIFWIG